MPISDFEGETFVAFIDISGFKELMKDEKRAWKALDKLYQYGYEVIRESTEQVNIRVEGLFISDSGILFVRDCQDLIGGLKIKELNKRMLKHDFMLTTSIAYGHFKYQERIEFIGIEKTQYMGMLMFLHF